MLPIRPTSRFKKDLKALFACPLFSVFVRWRITHPAHSAFPGTYTSAIPTARPTP